MSLKYFEGRNLKHPDSRPGDVCGIDGGAHCWRIKSYERYIGRGECDCGAVRFFSNSTFPSRGVILRLKYLNDKHGKPGKVYPGPAAAS